MNMELVDRARQERKSPSVLKTKLSQLRSRFQDKPILILEGFDDVGPYETWINRVVEAGTLKFLPGSGKEQLLGLRTLLARDETGLRASVFYAVDRDFDDLLGQNPGPDIFCTDRYSVENYVIDERVVASILRDELRLEEGSANFNAAIQAYTNNLNNLTSALIPVNFRIFCCRRLHIQSLSTLPEVRRFATINLSMVTANVNEQTLATAIPLASEPPELEMEALKNDFNSLDLRLHHRGKFLFQFLLSWVEKLAEEARNPSGELFKEKVNIKFTTATLSLRSLATRSEMPAGFRDFVTRMITPQ